MRLRDHYKSEYEKTELNVKHRMKVLANLKAEKWDFERADSNPR